MFFLLLLASIGFLASVCWLFESVGYSLAIQHVEMLAFGLPWLHVIFAFSSILLLVAAVGLLVVMGGAVPSSPTPSPAFRSLL